MILQVEIIVGFSSPCIDTPGGFGQGGAMGGSSGSNGSGANISSSSGSINLIPRVFFYSQTPLYGHPLNMDTLLLWTVCFSPGKESSYFSLNSTHIIRTPH